MPLLAPVSWLYGLLLRGRRLGYRRGLLHERKLPVPVISVGNLTLGGSGKTPCTMHLAREALSRGMRPGILTRGYRGTARGVRTVSDGKDILLGPGEAGDEAFMMARELRGIPVVKCPSRYEGGLHCLRIFGNDLFILDDGYQHYQLYRDVNMVLINRPEDLLRERLFPAGRLREPLSELARADEIVVTAEARALEAENRRGLSVWSPGVPVSTMAYRPDSLRNASGQTLSLDSLRGRDVVAFCGIAHPDRFRSTLKDLAVNVIEFRTFRDHHEYSEADLRVLVRRAGEVGAEKILTTEKDLVKIADERVWALRMSAELSRETLDRIFSRVQPSLA